MIIAQEGDHDSLLYEWLNIYKKGGAVVKNRNMIMYG